MFVPGCQHAASATARKVAAALSRCIRSSAEETMPPARYAARKPQADAAHGLPASANYEFSPESALESASAHTLHAELAIAEKVVHTTLQQL